MIEINGVSKKFNKKENVIDNLNLNVKNGEIFGFLGPNGAGKTTTIKMITGILNIDEGDILLDGKSISKEPIEAKKKFGLVSDDPNSFLKLTGTEYLNFIADVYEVSTKDRIERIEKLANEFEIMNVLTDKIESYSHGMRQKIMVIGSLLHNPQNWILDEPMTGLDPKASYMLKQKMREYASNNKTVFFSTHVLDVAERLCDRIGIINKGKLLFVGTYDELKSELKENKSLEELFIEITDDNDEYDLNKGKGIE